MTLGRAVFLDRDGVIVPDNEGALLAPEDVQLLDGVGPALAALKTAGFALILVTNQAVVARGLLTEAQLDEIHNELNRRLRTAGAPAFDAVFACPHHPHANVPAYRVACECRKPRPGMLLRAARERSLDLSASVMVGDRITDVLAGARAGCRTVLVEGPQTSAPPIVTSEPIDPSVRADHTCTSLADAARWILESR
ncbi:-heptose -bisphosphate phosphatase : D,D-heptose 1,7-bisphosphate phosphatase OS=uncultured bacterium GN=ACD_47C00467G0003 PE=3 SV=1: Hydrolase_like [Gemmata massiliana]|uniref:D,D-heptose 1,7-bisphosphate phosphatase n=1 Tax=Gemmata massiliana TaxID=1210884 RepID=A0A6P2D0J4_9BACT|nr:HAD family hydrolase [Gemmata massiliana]VTR93885.1 -heptose -bisphosphate phosphatase : D,D-heptose 1,7-bisphosphate phosphatase OS=uncultured bacterium GN=ACD_47C00467G0003 PE=3 SV=1: Hydrolase_like [Gemmata massiliana]